MVVYYKREECGTTIPYGGYEVEVSEANLYFVTTTKEEVAQRIAEENFELPERATSLVVIATNYEDVVELLTTSLYNNTDGCLFLGFGNTQRLADEISVLYAEKVASLRAGKAAKDAAQKAEEKAKAAAYLRDQELVTLARLKAKYEATP